MKKQIIFLLLFFISQLTYAHNGYEIKVKINNYEQEKLILAHYLGSTIFIDDTTRISPDGFYVFKGEKALPAGIYLIVMPPDNQFIEIILTEEERNYSLEFDAVTLTKDIVFKNAPDNALFYKYLHFMQETHPEIEALTNSIQKEKLAGNNSEQKEKKLDKLQAKVKNYQQTIIDNHPQTLTCTILKSNQKIAIPKFEGTEEEVRFKEYLYRRKHFFDKVKDDPRFFKSKIFNEMVQFYMDNLTVPHPDSIIHSVDVILAIIEPDSIAFKSYFFNFLNTYLQSNRMGMDAVFVHMVKEYTMKGKTNFFPEKTREKIIKDALLWNKTLIGKTAPDLKNYVLDIEGSIKAKDAADENRRFALKGKTSLHSIFKPYTVVIFWAPDCGHCKKSMPVLVDFYEKNQELVEVFAICHYSYKEYAACAEALTNYKAIKWINTVDPYYKYIKDYDIQTTPLILLLGAEKEVLFKKIAVEDLEKAIEQMKLEKKSK